MPTSEKEKSSLIANLRSRAQKSLPSKSAGVIIGLALLACGQLLMNSSTAQTGDWFGLRDWGQEYHIAIVNLENVVVGLAFILAGGIVCAWLCLPKDWQVLQPALGQPSVNRVKGNRLKVTLLAGLYSLVLIPLVKNNYSIFLVFLWAFILLTACRLAWQSDRRAGIELNPKLDLADVGWILSLLCAGIIVGAFFLEDIPNQLIADEGSFWETARAIARKEFLPPFWGAGVYTFPIASSHVQAWVMRIFGVTVWGWRFSSVLVSVLACIPLYLFMREWFGRRPAIAAGIFMLSNPYFLSFARLGYNNAQALFPVTLCIYLASLAVKKSSKFYYCLSGIAAGLGFYTYPSSWLGIVVLVFSGMILLISGQKKFLDALKAGAILLSAWLATILPNMVYTLSGEASHALTFKIFETSFFSAFYARAIFTDAHPELITTLIGKNEVVLSPQLWSGLLLRGTIRTLVALFDPHLVNEHFMTTGLAGGWSGIFFVVGLFLALRRFKDQRFGILAIWTFAGLLFLGILAAFPPRHTHMVSIIPAIAALSSLGFIAVLDSLTNPRHAHDTPASRELGLYTTGLLVLAVFGLRQYFIVMPDRYRPNFEDIVSWNAWRNREPATIYYIEEEPDIHKAAYVVNRKMALHEYLNLDIPTFTDQDATYLALKPSMVFYPTDEDNRIMAKLAGMNAGFHAPIQYTDSTGNAIGYGTANTDKIKLHPALNFWQGLKTFFQSPAFYVLIVLFIGLAGIGWKSRVHQRIPKLSQPGKTLELEFKVRVALPDFSNKKDDQTK